jgi:hypothetical protein
MPSEHSAHSELTLNWPMKRHEAQQFELDLPGELPSPIVVDGPAIEALWERLTRERRRCSVMERVGNGAWRVYHYALPTPDVAEGRGVKPYGARVSSFSRGLMRERREPGNLQCSHAQKRVLWQIIGPQQLRFFREDSLFA